MGINALGGASFEAGSLVELSDFSPNGLDILTSPAPASALETYLIRLRTVATELPFAAIAQTSNETDWITVGWYLRLDRSPSTANFNLFTCVGDFRISMGVSSGDVNFYNSSDANFVTLTDPFNDDQWYRIIVKFKRSSSSAIRFWIDGVLVVDDTTGLLASSPSNLRFNGPIRNLFQEAEYFISSCWAITDDGANIDTNDTTRRDWHAKIYQATDEAAGSVGAEDDLDSGTWADACELLVDDTDSAKFSVSGSTPTRVGGFTTDDADSSVRPGPRNDSDVEGADSILAIWHWRFKQETGLGNTNHIGRFGRQVFGSEDVVNMADAGSQVASTTEWKNSNHHGASASEGMPATDEWFQQGFKAFRFGGPGTRTISTSHMFAALIFEEAAPTGRLALIGGKLLKVS